MNQLEINGEELVFGLDIGTRSVVGTIGYKQGERFVVVAQEIREHQTRAMLDGQIHDINRVAATLADIKKTLQEKTGLNLEEVCIAAAGRVLRTMNVHVDMDFEKERSVTKEDMSTLVSMGVEKAFSDFQKANDTEIRFYCVGHSVIKYYLNGLWMGQPEHHKAKNIGADIIATFLPDDVVDGLYSAVNLAGLRVANLTLEPIAAIRVAIPEKFRLLNIAMLDIGAGTSDISITNDGSVVAFGMLPHAGDILTETLAKTCLIDFATAEKIKTAATTQSVITYEDIMGLEQTISAEEVVAICQPQIEKMAKLTADTIVELNGGTSPSAVFIVGGGGKIKGFSERIAAELGLEPNRVALRGEEILRDVDFPEGCLKDSTIITPIGICLSYYEQSNNFIYITFNGSRVKLYDNNKLAVVDAAMQASFTREGLFPRRGKELHYTVNGKNRVKKGEYGESAHIYVNGEAVNLNYNIKANDVIVIEESTIGRAAEERIVDLVDYNGKLTMTINGEELQLPKPVKVNGQDQSSDYLIQEGDSVSFCSYYTYDELIEYMGYPLEDTVLIVNDEQVTRDVAICAHDSVDIKSKKELEIKQKAEAEKVESEATGKTEATGKSEAEPDAKDASQEGEKTEAESISDGLGKKTETSEAADVLKSMMEDAIQEGKYEPDGSRKIIVIVNQSPIVMKGKKSYTFVDIFDYIDFDTSKMRGAGIATLVNGKDAQYTQELHNGDKIEVYWK